MMKKRSSGNGRAMSLVMLLTIAACSDAEEEQRALRDALARLPQDTAAAVDVGEGGEQALPAESALFEPPDTVSTSLPDTAGILDVLGADPQGEDTMQRDGDTGYVRLRPGRPLDTEPWIPERDTRPLTPEWGDDARESSADAEGSAILENVRTARNDEYDRIVFEFAEGRIPGYRVEFVERPVHQCGSGQEVPLDGESWLRVRLEPSQAHDERGRATVQDRTRDTRLPVLRELRLICDYEGQVEWVLGFSSPTVFRVAELSSPARLVLDVRSRR